MKGIDSFFVCKYPSKNNLFEANTHDGWTYGDMKQLLIQYRKYGDSWMAISTYFKGISINKLKKKLSEIVKAALHKMLYFLDVHNHYPFTNKFKRLDCSLLIDVLNQIIRFKNQTEDTVILNLIARFAFVDIRKIQAVSKDVKKLLLYFIYYVINVKFDNYLNQQTLFVNYIDNIRIVPFECEDTAEVETFKLFLKKRKMVFCGMMKVGNDLKLKRVDYQREKEKEKINKLNKLIQYYQNMKRKVKKSYSSHVEKIEFLRNLDYDVALKKRESFDDNTNDYLMDRLDKIRIEERRSSMNTQLNNSNVREIDVSGSSKKRHKDFGFMSKLLNNPSLF